jgi:hypothetical protein
MPKTAEEISLLHPQNVELQMWLADPAVSVRGVQDYMHAIAYKDHSAFKDRPFTLARVALDVRIADEAGKSAENLSRQTQGLSQNVTSLVAVAEEQKNLAKKLDRQTNQLITLTRVLVVVTVVLFLLAIIQTCIMLKESAH